MKEQIRKNRKIISIVSVLAVFAFIGFNQSLQTAQAPGNLTAAVIGTSKQEVDFSFGKPSSLVSDYKVKSGDKIFYVNTDRNEIYGSSGVTLSAGDYTVKTISGTVYVTIMTNDQSYLGAPSVDVYSVVRTRTGTELSSTGAYTASLKVVTPTTIFQTIFQPMFSFFRNLLGGGQPAAMKSSGVKTTLGK